MKERIIGAVVLVALVVLIVPVFLDGPPAEQQVLSERVPLPGQDESQTQTVVLDRDRTEPVPSGPAERSEPVKESPPAASPSGVPVPATDTAAETAQATTETPAVRAEETAPATAAPSSAASSTGMFAVQLGSFSNRENAEKLAADLRQKGFAAFLSQLGTSGGALQRVRIGPLADREAAEKVAAQLARAGYEGQVVPHP